jgi:hypothetical protein
MLRSYELETKQLRSFSQIQVTLPLREQKNGTLSVLYGRYGGVIRIDLKGGWVLESKEEVALMVDR